MPPRRGRHRRGPTPSISWPLATWLTPAVSMVVFGLMVFGTVAEPARGATVFLAIGVAAICLTAGVLLAGGALSGGLGLWTVLR